MIPSKSSSRILSRRLSLFDGVKLFGSTQRILALGYVVGVGGHDLGEPLFQIAEVRGQAEDGHDLGGDGVDAGKHHLVQQL